MGEGIPTGNKKKEIDEEQVKNLLAKLTLDEKINQMAGKPFIHFILQIAGYGKYSSFDTPSIERLGIPGIKFIDGPRGVGFKGSTAFPVAMARGATWDVELEERVGTIIGYEAAAGGANLCGAVCINVLRHPSWGRAQETFGEDPYHIGSMGAGLTRGLQKHVMACVKHFAANSIEESRFFVDVEMDERTLREIYLPHFKMCVDAGAASVMSAYNKLNGEYCGHNRHLLREILKEDWNFKGYVVSDFLYGVRNGEDAANAGLDLEMPFPRHFGKKLKKAVLSGRVSESKIDESVSRLLKQQLRFLHSNNETEYDKEIVGGDEHAALAREVSQKGTVLLKNEDGALPLIQGKIKKIAVLGRLADRINLGDRGSSTVRPPYAVTPFEGIKKRAGDSIEVIQYSGRRISRAKKIAEKSDAVVIVAGFTWKEEGEYIREVKVGGDRLNLDLLQRDVKLINAVSSVNDRCIVALESGTAIAMGPWIENIQAILMIWYPGMEGGNALADILFGDVNPSGKLPVNFPESGDQLFKFDNKAEKVNYNYYHGYRYFDKLGYKPLFPFGFGLSYTKYCYQNLKLSAGIIAKDGELDISVDVTNTGEMAGEEIVQLYIGYNGPQVDRPEKELKGFGRIALKPGETGTVNLKIRTEDLAYWDIDSGDWVVEAIEYAVYIGGSSMGMDLGLSDTFRVEN